LNPTRILRSLLAERLGQTAGRWPRELFGEANAPTLRQAIAERMTSPAPRPPSPIEAMEPRLADMPDAGSGGAGQRPLRRTEDREIAADNFFPVAEDMAGTDVSAVSAVRRRSREMTPTEIEVPIRDLQATQHSVRDDFGSTPMGDLPQVYRDASGRMLIVDGHNRAFRVAQSGADRIRVRFYDDAAHSPDGGASGAVTFAREINGRREFNTPNITVFVENTSDSPQPMLHWELRDDRSNSLSDTETLAGRSRLQQEGIAAAIDTIRQDGGAAYRVRGATESMGRRYLRLAQEQAEAGGYRFRQDGRDLIVERRAPDAPNAVSRTDGGASGAGNRSLGDEIADAEAEIARLLGQPPPAPRVRSAAPEAAPSMRETLEEGARRADDFADATRDLNVGRAELDELLARAEQLRAARSPNAGPRGNGRTVAALAALPPGALTLRELLRDRYGAA